MKRILFASVLLAAVFAGCVKDGSVKESKKNELDIRLLRSVQAHRGYVFYVGFSRDLSAMASGGADNAVRIWNTKDWTERMTIPEEYHAMWGIPLDYSPDGQYLAIGAFDTLKLLAVGENYREIAAMKTRDRGIQSVAFSPVSNYVVSAGVDGVLTVWSVPNLSNVSTVKAHTSEVWSVCVSPDGKNAVTGGEDSTFKIWSFPDLKEVKTVKFHTLPVEYVRISHDGTMVLAASADSTVSVWKWGEFNAPYRLLRAHMGSVLTAEFYVNDKLIFSGGDDDSIYAYDISGGDIVYQLKEHFGDVMTIAFSPDGKWMASGSRDRAVKVWSIDY